jgi:sec-independent protein translocase protein TatB
MFDIGFSELVVIGVVALVVIGPERLPKTARTMGHLFGRLQRYVNDVKSDISREMELEELRKLHGEVKSAAADLKSSVEGAARDIESGAREVEKDLNSAGETPAVSAEDAIEAAGTPSETPSATPESPPAALASGAKPASMLEAEPLATDPPRQSALPGFDRI